jgi:hypothetical protein
MYALHAVLSMLLLGHTLFLLVLCINVCCVVLCCAVPLYCAVLCCAMLCSTIPCCAAAWFGVLLRYCLHAMSQTSHGCAQLTAEAGWDAAQEAPFLYAVSKVSDLTHALFVCHVSN